MHLKRKSLKYLPMFLIIHLSSQLTIFCHQVDSHKHLGLVFHRSLSWHTHVVSLYHKAITRLNVLRHLRLSLPRYALLILHRSYILPLLDYGDVIYDNISTADSCRLENVQATAAKRILGDVQIISHLKILNELSMSPLHLRRCSHILFALHKILLGPCPTFLATATPKLFRDISCFRNWSRQMALQALACRRLSLKKVNKIFLTGTLHQRLYSRLRCRREIDTAPAAELSFFLAWLQSRRLYVFTN